MADVKQINLNGTIYSIMDDTARTNASNALSKATSAETKAGQAQTAAETAQTTAESAKTTATSAQSTATTANKTANLALTGSWNITFTQASSELKFTKVEAS